MFSSSSPPATPRFRPLDAAEEPLILPQYQEVERSGRSKRPLWISRGQLIQLGVLVLLSLGVWGILVGFASSPVEVQDRPVKPQVAVVAAVDINSITELNATILDGDGVGARKWTIAIPAGIKTPLRPSVYGGICQSAHGVSTMARFPGIGHENGAGHHNYYWIDDLFVDPADSGESVEVEQGKDLCDTSLTYLLESTNAGFGVALMGLWSAYGLAKQEGRAFFIDDRDWAWGSYSTYFVPPPTPICAPPPPHWLLPCPHTAKHLVVASSTHAFVFGHGFVDQFEDPRKMEVMRQVKIFDIVRQGYEALFRLGLTEDGLSAVEDRKHATPGPAVAVHIRRGDGRPLDWGFKQIGYVPLEKYAEAARNLLEIEDIDKNGTIVCASDDPAICSAPNFAGFEPAQYVPQSPPHQPKPRTDTPNAPGFIAENFWNMNMDQRAQMGKLYVRDLKIMGELAARAGGSAICDISSVTCRLLAVIMGWQKGILDGGWVNIDGDFDWNGVDW